MLKENIHPVDQYAGDQLRKMRLDSALSQEELAKKLAHAITFQQIQKYERGQNRISASRLWEIAQVFNVPPSYFFPPSKAEPIYCSNTSEIRLLKHFRQLPSDKQNALLNLIKVEV